MTVITEFIESLKARFIHYEHTLIHEQDIRNFFRNFLIFILKKYGAGRNKEIKV